ncbi:MAG: hypothetical protein RIC55_09230 [Pirellulaceae bacterium]
MIRHFASHVNNFGVYGILGSPPHEDSFDEARFFSVFLVFVFHPCFIRGRSLLLIWIHGWNTARRRRNRGSPQMTQIAADDHAVPANGFLDRLPNQEEYTKSVLKYLRKSASSADSPEMRAAGAHGERLFCGNGNRTR